MNKTWAALNPSLNLTVYNLDMFVLSYLIGW